MDPSEDVPATGGPAREAVEREAARRRGEARARGEDGGSARAPDRLGALRQPGVAHHAFEALADNVRDYAIFLMDADGVIVFWGEGARLIKWWTRDQAEGGHLRLLYPDGGSEDGTAEAHLRESAECGEYTGEGHRMRSDGSTFWAGVTLTALRDAEGTLLGFAKVTRDLTAQRTADAARRAALDAAEEASRLKGLFLATMSHEIRTPLNAIMAYTDLLGMELEGPLTPGQHEQLGKIHGSSEHLLAIVDDVLDLSRIEAGRMVASRGRLRVGDVVAAARLMVEPQAAAQGVELVDSVSGHAVPHHCWGDEERARQVLLNLLGNAVKFTGRGGRITISAGTAATPPHGVALEGDGPWVYIRVEDTGTGIPLERQEAVFEPFVQADMTFTRQHGGTGLGLAIARQLARLMGGELSVRSEPGVGSSFFFWLAAAPADEGAPVPPMPSEGRDGTLLEVRDAILGDLERIVHAYVARLRSDPDTPQARALSEAELEDHLATFLSDIAQSFGAMELADGAESELLRAGTAIQRTIAERHGRQRARLGWSEAELRRESQVLREELTAAVRRQVQRPRPAEVEEVAGVLEESVSLAERVSLESLRTAARS